MVSHDHVFRFLRALREEQDRAPGTIKTYRLAYHQFWQYLQSKGLPAKKTRVTQWVTCMWPTLTAS